MECDQAPKQRLTAIFLDDDAGQAHLLARYMAMVDWADVDLHHYTRPERVLAPLLGGQAQLFFLDHDLGTRDNGLDVLRNVRNAGYQGPIIMLTNHEEPNLIAEFNGAGADAYLCKSNMSAARVSSIIKVAMTMPHHRGPRILRDGEQSIRHQP